MQCEYNNFTLHKWIEPGEHWAECMTLFVSVATFSLNDMHKLNCIKKFQIRNATKPIILFVTMLHSKIRGKVQIDLIQLDKKKMLLTYSNLRTISLPDQCNRWHYDKTDHNFNCQESSWQLCTIMAGTSLCFFYFSWFHLVWMI